MAPYFVLATLLALVAAVVLAWPLRGSRPLFAGLVIAIPMMALSLYQLVGTPAGLDPAQRRAPETLEQAITQLQADLERDPRQVEGWRLLGRALQQQERYAEARDAFARAARLDPEDLGLQTEYAESRSRADAQRRFDDEAIGILERVLELDTAQHRARLFLGIGYRQHGRSAEAAATWEPLLPTLGGEAAAGLRLQINEARVHAGLDPLPDPDPVDTAAGEGLRVRVVLDPDFAARVRLDPAAVVFVIARAPDGPPMPVAAQRHTVADLPLDIVLGDADSPMPTQPLSALQEVEVLARISSSGSATPQDGDLSSAPVRVTLPNSEATELVLGPARDGE
ncbi:tetratricopeptide repeat protein [Luteimonas sp. YGD11-2]|uniref:tetratricopeptide repeat protein n=1 Tax=Luteimonas sp. YGD11-2 TaxID=2508168 RepID=UPI00100BFF8D|nr:tetratricopeptide repeat protein [Luteimonas sp. YGD11-2]